MSIPRVSQFASLIVGSALLWLVVCCDASARAPPHSARGGRELSEDFYACVERANGFHMVILGCSNYERNRLESILNLTEKRVSFAVSPIDRRAFLKAQKRWNDNLGALCDNRFGYDLFKSDSDPYVDLDFEACYLLETAKRIRWLQRHYRAARAF
jgi:uncharacterized protein YecT (DUF1311 family)